MEPMGSERVVRELADQLSRELPELANKCRDKTKTQTREWTWAVGQFWKEYCQSKNQKGQHPWDLCGKDHATKDKGEYLVDFMLFEEGYGSRIACESEWGKTSGEVLWDFEKLTGVKSDVKVLIHECRSQDLLQKLRGAISGNALIYPGEAFLIFGFQGETSEALWWIPKRNGPFDPKDIIFQKLSK